MTSFSVIVWVYIHLMLAISVSCGKSESYTSYNETQDEYPQRSGRLKRSAYTSMPSFLRIRLRDELGNVINLEWEQQEGFLANEHLPVITPLRENNPYLMSHLGEMVMYFDVAENSAVIFFEKTQSFYGVVGMDYYVANLPNNFDNNGNYRSGELVPPYLIRHENPFNFNSDLQFIRLLSDTTTHPIPDPSNVTRTSSGTVESTTTKIRTDTKKKDGGSKRGHFLETLIFIADDVVKIFKEIFNENYLTPMISHYIIYFNAIDMLFDKLQSRRTSNRLFINIAKIIVEDDLLPLPFLNDPILRFDDVIEKTREYLNFLQSTCPPDSYDYVFISTGRRIWHRGDLVMGSTSHGADMYQARLSNQFHTAVPISMMQIKPDMSDYPYGASLIASQFGISDDPFVRTVSVERPCSSRTQVEGTCHNCLDWSSRSKNQLEQFIRFSSIKRNYCFLLNEPRSLLPPGVHGLVSKGSQCKCYGYHVHWLPSERVRMKTDCNQPILCMDEHASKEIQIPTVVPFDGTSCENKKVCWNRECRPKQTVQTTSCLFTPGS